jgi:GNAT superfamily N-acetyltransferase
MQESSLFSLCFSLEARLELRQPARTHFYYSVHHPGYWENTDDKIEENLIRTFNSMVPQLPEGFHVRPAMPSDVEQVVELIRLCQQQELGFANASVGTLSRAWNSTEMDLDRDTWLVFTPQNCLIVYASFMHFQSPRLEANLRIHPDYATAELYSSIMSAIEERAHQFFLEIQPDIRITLNTICTDRVNPAIRTAIEQAGFVQVRRSFRMEIEMDAPPPAAIWPEGIELRPFTLSQAPAVHAADNEAFQDHWGFIPLSYKQFDFFFLKSTWFDPTLWFVAYDGEEIAGAALCQKQEDISFVDNLFVRRPWRKQGLGLTLLYHAFSEFYRRGERKAALFVDAQNLTGATRLYERAGMHMAYRFDHFEKELRPGIELSVQELAD